MKNKSFYFFTIFSIILLIGLFLIKNMASILYFPFLEKIYILKKKNKVDAQWYFLLHQMRALEERYNKLSFLSRELALFKKHIKNANTFNRTTLSADVLGYVINKKNKFFFINRGTIDGIGKSMIVISGSTLLGKISEVYKHYAKVTTIDNSDQYIPALFEQSNCNTILQGHSQYMENTMISLPIVKDDISTKQSIIKGEKVFTSGKGLSYPVGFYIGEVIQNNSVNSYENKIIIQNNFNFSTLDSCEIILDYTPLEGISFH